jgi:hypothetical protein
VVGWGPFSVSVTDENVTAELDETSDSIDPLDPAGAIDGLESLDSLDEDEDGEVIDGFDPEEGRLQLIEDAGYLAEGLEPSWLTRLDLNAEDEDEREIAQAEANYVAGALFQASVIVLDDLFEDLDTLRQERFGSTVAEASDDTFLVLDELPPRYAHRYDALFTQQLIVAMVDVTRRFTAGWEPLGCIAQELALRLILNGAEVQLELAEVELEEDWRAGVEAALFEDPDHEMLFDASLDGIEDDSEFLATMGAAPMAFADWFKPFKPERHLPPYLLDQGGQEPDAGEDEADDDSGDDDSNDELDDATPGVDESTPGTN